MYLKNFTKLHFLARIFTCAIIFNFFIFHQSYGGHLKIESTEKMIVAPAGTSYQWFFEGKEIFGANEQSLQVGQSGVYSLLAIDPEGREIKETIKIVVEGKAIRKIFLIGDSTVQDYRGDKYPMAGWGQVIKHFFHDSAFSIVNRAIGGRSSRGFIEEGRWVSVKSELSEGDYLFIQWGHNDRDWTKDERWTPPADYYTYLKQYVNEAREIGAIPVLISPMTLNAWRNGALRNVFTESGSDYRGEMLKVANELDVPFVDLNMKSHKLVSDAGVEYASRFLYNTYVPGEYANYPNGLNDFTHFQEMGAIEMAKIIANGIGELKEDPRVSPLADQLMPLYPVTVEVNNADAGMTTHSASYPAGVTVTLKALPAQGHTFLNWKNGDQTIAGTGNIYSFPMGSEERKFYALYDEETAIDCAGDFNGTADIDDCGVCSGGSSQVEPCVAAYQMEEACAIEGIVEAAYDGFRGAGYAVPDKTAEAVIEWTMDAPAATEVVLTFRYANGADTPLSGKLMVNEAETGDLTFLPTEAWYNWNTESVTVALEEGQNAFTLSASTSAGLANLDLISMTTTEVVAGECPEAPLSLAPLSQMKARVRIYPNPFSNNLVLESKGLVNYKIYDLSGKLQATGSCSGTTTIATPLSVGLYQLILQTAEGSFATKIIKK